MELANCAELHVGHNADRIALVESKEEARVRKSRWSAPGMALGPVDWPYAFGLEVEGLSERNIAYAMKRSK